MVRTVHAVTSAEPQQGAGSQGAGEGAASERAPRVRGARAGAAVAAGRVAGSEESFNMHEKGAELSAGRRRSALVSLITVRTSTVS